MKKWLKTGKNGSKFFLGCHICWIKTFATFFYFLPFSLWYFQDPVFEQFWRNLPKNRVLEVPKGKSWEIKKDCKCCYLTYVTSQKKFGPIFAFFSHFFMSYFDVLGSIFEKCAMTDLPNIIVSMCLVSYNFCMIPHVCSLTFGLNLSGAWGE